MSFIHLVEPRGAVRLPIFALGFRPFFLLAGLFAALGVPLWLLIHRGTLDVASALPAFLWHGHEMVFGFAAAVIAGFLLTAASNWTGRQTATGAGLAALVALWLAGRCVLLLGGGLPSWLVAGIDAAFLPVLAVVLAVPLLRAGNRRNVVFSVILLVLGGLNLAIHLSNMGVVDWDASRLLRGAIDLVLLMIGVLGGRVIPSFTGNALKHARIAPCPKANILALASLVLVAVSDLLPGDLLPMQPTIAGFILLAAGLLNLLRMRGWGSFATLGTPILWILHVGYAWVGIGLVLRGLAAFIDLVPEDAGLHALTVGAIGSMILGMMTRVALGHTGRPIHPARLTVAAYWLLNLAAISRLFAHVIEIDGAHMALLDLSGSLWSLAFLLFVAVYAPILVRPRADGRPG